MKLKGDSRAAGWFSVVVLAAVLSGCPRRLAIWIAEGADAGHLVFLLGSKPGIEETVQVGVLRVDPCAVVVRDSTTTAWLVTSWTQRVSRITYGRLPEGFTEVVPAKPLQVGCYHATVSGSPGSVRFEVTTTGQVKALE